MPLFTFRLSTKKIGRGKKSLHKTASQCLLYGISHSFTEILTVTTASLNGGQVPGMSKNLYYHMYYHNLAMSPQQRQPDTQQTESLGKGEREAGVGREGKKDSVIHEQHKKIVSTAPWQLLRLFQALQTFCVLEILTYTC